MTLSDLSIKRPVFAWMLMCGLIAFGWISMTRLGISQMPDYDFPVLNISVTWAGAAPEVMEAEIVDRLEQEIISVQGIREISSSIRQGSANITMEFDIDRNIDAALQEVQSAISSVKLPEDVDPPTIRKTNPDDQPIMWLGVSSTRSIHDLVVYADLYLRDQFQIVPGVGEVMLGGFSERNLRIWVDNEKLKKYELTILDVQNAVAAQHIETAAGVIENNQQEMNLRSMGEGMTPEQIGDILIDQRGGKTIYDTTIHIKDIARVEDGLNDIRRLARIQGQTGLGLGIKKQRGENAVEVGRRVKQRMDEINKRLPDDIRIGVNFDSTTFIKDSISETQFALILSAIVTALVCFLFLGTWDSTLNVLLSIPTSVIGSFMVLYFMGFTLNMFTLLGLALAIGIVVDDAIMVLENIVRHFQMGKDRVNASTDGAREITFAAIAASVAVIAIFLPVAFMKGIIGKFFFQFGVTISAAVALSLLEAITLTPMRCSQLLQRRAQPSKLEENSSILFERVAGVYRRLLDLSLNWRWTVVCASLGLFALSLTLAYFVNKEFIPAQDQSMFLARFQAPVGTSLTATSEKIKPVEAWLATRPDVKRYFMSVGGFGGGEVNTGMIFITLKPKSEREMSQAEFMDFFRKEVKQLSDMKFFAQDLSLRGFTAQRGFPVEFNIRGPEWNELNKLSQEIIKRMNETGLVIDLDTDYRLGQPEVRVYPDREKCAASGVDMNEIGKTINAAIGGIREGKFTNGGRRYDVRIRLDAKERATPESIASLQVRTAYGELLNLGDLARIETASTLQTITRRDRERSISIFANVAPGKSQASALDAAERIGKEVLPEGYHLVLGGGARTFKESFGSLGFALAMGVIVAYMVLGAQFNSFLHPVTVLLALPFSISGAFLALLISRQSLNLYSMIGIILLMGIVKKNSILLVEFTNKKRFEDGMPLREALLTAAPIRLRPILMTSCATIAAALPPALAFGPGAESRIPMSVTVIGGVLISTLFTLFVVPCAYSLFSKLEHYKPVKS
ncbi:MAG: efflux RND transporter permease subunit [Verrucomicrobiota bacterium]